MEHPAAVLEKARRLEQLLQRVATDESIEQARNELGLQIQVEDLPELRRKYETGGRRMESLIDGRYGHGQKVNSAMREWLYERKGEDDELTAHELADELEGRFGVRVAAGHINYLLRKRGMTRPPGHPYRHETPQTTAEGTAESAETPSQTFENAGLFFPGGSQAGDGG